MTDSASALYHSLMDGEKSEEELATDTRLRPAAVQNGLRELLHEGKVQKQTDNGTVLWRLG